MDSRYTLGLLLLVAFVFILGVAVGTTWGHVRYLRYLESGSSRRRRPWWRRLAKRRGSR